MGSKGSTMPDSTLASDSCRLRPLLMVDWLGGLSPRDERAARFLELSLICRWVAAISFLDLASWLRLEFWASCMRREETLLSEVPFLCTRRQTTQDAVLRLQANAPRSLICPLSRRIVEGALLLSFLEFGGCRSFFCSILLPIRDDLFQMTVHYLQFCAPL